MTSTFYVILLIMWYGQLQVEGSDSELTCASPQYLELGTISTIHCKFQETFFSVLWYDTSDYTTNDPILRYENHQKFGPGYESGEFDVHPNASIIVKNVSLTYEGIFTAVYVHTRKEGPVVSKIRIIVVVKSDINFPHIVNCKNNSRTCYLNVDSSIQCSVRNVRPSITLKWMVRTINGDKDIVSNLSVISADVGYTSLATTRDAFHFSPVLALLVCKASTDQAVLKKNESVILVQNSLVSLFSAKPILKYAERTARFELKCTDDTVGFFVWKRLTSVGNAESEDLLYSVLTGEQHTKVYVDDVTVDGDGTLVIPQLEVKHEGIYFCIFGDGLTDGWITYDVKVTVHPVITYPDIEGCNHQQYCVLEAENEGSLTCTVEGIRPQVELEWRAFHDSEADSIFFTTQKSTVQTNGETHDVTLTSTYHLRDKSRDRLTIECRVPESDELFHLTTKADLLFKDQNGSKTNRLSWIIPTSVTSAILLILCWRTINKCKKKSKRKSSNMEETTFMLPAKVYNAKIISDLKEKLLKEMKGKYKDLYEAVQPIPYIRDKLYCVDKVFVEGGIEVLESPGPLWRRGIWKSLKTHDNVFNDERVASPRRILEGEPGYGKSTVTLQFAYDWCNQNPSSALKDVEILILLRLRQLGGVPSIYKAIKRFILPRDTTISETDIDYILRSSKSVVVILDGFDEYPDQDSITITDVMTIIARQMFQDFDVITTTRSSFLPKKYPPLTKRIRLTGFDAKARRYYIRKAVVGEDDEGVRKIEGYLQENPILSDLCQVPLLFVIFAHMMYESQKFRKLNSVTSFFRHMISCFRNHMENKMNDENVRRYELLESNHHALDKLAFEALSGKSPRLVWEKEKICQLLGQELYEQYIRIGILVEEEGFNYDDDPGIAVLELAQYKNEVRFYHKLFCEWYAAHYLTDYLQKNPNVNVKEICRHLDPFDVQYLYRFSCGLSSTVTEKIIKYLKNTEGGYKFVILCIQEQTMTTESIKETIRQLCDEGIIISGHDSLLLQRSSMEVLGRAANNDICVKEVILHNCFQSVDISTPAVRTTSGLILHSKIQVKDLDVSLYNREMTEDEAIAILEFSSMCPSLKFLWFHASVPPQSFKIDSTLSTLKSRNIKVKFQMFKDKPVYILNLETGRWEGELSGNEPSPEEYEKMRSSFASHLKSSTEEFQREDVNNMRKNLSKKAGKGGKNTST